MKKKICICMALALLLSAAQPALASELTVYGEVAVPPLAEILAEDPALSMEVPATSWVVANPYHMEVEQDGVSSTDDIVSPVLVLENQSGFPVRVDVRAVGTTPYDSEAVFVTTPPEEDTVGKELFLYAEFQEIPDPDDTPVWLGGFYDAYNQLLITESGLSKDGVMDLEAAGSEYSQGAMRVFGSVAPATPDRFWQKSDSFSINFVFTYIATGEATVRLPDTERDAASGLPFDTLLGEDPASAGWTLPGMWETIPGEGYDPDDGPLSGEPETTPDEGPGPDNGLLPEEPETFPDEDSGPDEEPLPEEPETFPDEDGSGE